MEAIKDKNTGQTLVEILQGFNMYFLPYNGNTSSTRCLVPTMLRKKGLWITYVKYDGNVYTEWYAADELDDKSWGDSSNWRIGNNTLVGDITISANGNWVINGTETEFKAVGEKGNTPLIRVANNRLQVSYDLGDTYMNVTENPVYTQFRNHNNKIQVSTDLGATWTDISDEISAYFRWQATTGDTQANNVGRVQISRDNKTWTNLSNDIVNNLHISRYIGVNESLPTSGIAEGTIYAKGPYYAEDDTLNANPIYRLWVYAWKDNTLDWQDNGEFQSVAAGVVQTTGDSEIEIMSQAAVTRELSELGSEVNYILNGESTTNIITKTYQGDGKGNGYASFLVVDNLTDKFNYKLIAVTDLTYVSTDGATHDFISLCNTSAGSSTSLSPFAETRGSIGDVIAAGTIVHEGVFTPSVASAVFVRTRMRGSVRLEYYIGEQAEKDVTYDELKKNVKSNSASILSNTQQLSSQAAKLNSVESSVSSVNTKIEKMDSRLDELDGEQPEVYSVEVSGDGVGGTTIRQNAVNNVSGLFIYRLVAVTDLIYTSSDGAEHTFVDIVSYPTGTTTSISLIVELRGNVGDTISAGTVVHEGSTTFDSAVDIYVRSRMRGTVKLEYSFSYGTDGIRDIVNSQSASIANHETRIQKLETASPSESTIVEQYKHQVNRALQLGYVESRAATDWAIKPLVFMHISDTHSAVNNTRAFEVLNYLGANGFVQFLMHTGDILEDPKNAA
jgi:hypothetical protein